MNLLQAINIDQLLNLHITNYLRQKNAQMLRQDCLNVRPIEPIIQMTSVQLKADEEQEIHTRLQEIARSGRRHSPNHSIENLTTTNLEKLDRDIREKRTEIDSLRMQLENLASEKCHSTFLDILEHSLQNNLLIHIQNNETTALLSIITHMRQHIADLSILENSQKALNKVQLKLNNQLAMRAATKSSTTHIDTDNGLISDANVQLLEANRQLNCVKENFLDERNGFAQCALIASIPTATAVTLNFLVGGSTLLFTLLLSPIIVLVIGFLITSSIAWINAASTQSEINENHDKYLDNLDQIAKNSQEITALSNQQLPAIETAIQQYQQEVKAKQEQVTQATANARNSFAEAQKIEGIEIFLPSVSQSSLGLFSVMRQNHVVNPSPTVAFMI